MISRSLQFYISSVIFILRALPRANWIPFKIILYPRIIGICGTI